MQVTRGPPLSKPRKLYRFTGLGTQLRYGVHDHSLGNVRRGLVERVFMVEVNGDLQPTPKPTPGAFDQLSRFRSELRKHQTPTTRMTPEEFLGFYSGRKLENYKKAVESLAVCALEPKDAWLSTFVKAEKLCLSKKPDPAPRVIQPRSARFNVEVGRYLRHSEKYLYKAIDGVFGGRTIFKGINSDEAGIEIKDIWDSFRSPVAIGMDASRFDQHISRQALEYEHSVWLDMFPPPQRKHLKYLLKMQINNKGLARCPDGEVRYSIEGCRMSGDMNTSSGNCLIMCATVWNWCKSNGIAKFRLANNGDDCVVFMEKTDESKFMDGCKQYYTGLGFTMKIEAPVYELEHVEFCQTRPIFVGSNYRMIRNLHQCVSKDLHCIHDLSLERDAKAWVDAVGEGGRCLNSGVPVLQAFYERFPKAAEGLKGQLLEKYLEDRVFKFHTTRTDQHIEPTPETRYSFWLAFGLTPDEQIALEREMGEIVFDQVVTPTVEEEPSLFSFSRA